MNKFIKMDEFATYVGFLVHDEEFNALDPQPPIVCRVSCFNSMFEPRLRSAIWVTMSFNGYWGDYELRYAQFVYTRLNR